MSTIRLLARNVSLAGAGLACVAVLPLLLAQAPAAEKKYAILVGVKEYNHAKLHNLEYAEADVVELGRVLKDNGYQVVLLTTAATDARLRPTLANINDRLGDILKDCTKRDTVLVGLSGHGLQPDGKKDAFFCPQDARPDRTETLVSLADLYKRMDDSGAGVKLLLVDACRDDPGASKGVAGNRAPRPPTGMAALFSCSAGEQSWESRKLKHGVFFHFVLKGMGEAGLRNRRGELTWDALQVYVRDHVSEEVAELVGSEARQTPSLNAGEMAGRSPVILSLLRPQPLDCTGEDGVSAAEVRRAQEAWAKYLGREVEEEIEVADGVKMTFVLIPPGKFLMGSPPEEKDRESNREANGGDETLHEVTLTDPFDMGKTEVTQVQYQALGLDNPSKFKGAHRPVEGVNWFEAWDWTEKLTKKRGDKYRYRLPTEGEWEYSCRGGRSSAKPFGIGEGGVLSSREANVNGNYPYGMADKGTNLEATCDVASYRANAFGLYDMHGNVWEWCADWFGKYPPGPLANPKGPESGFGRTLRGGGWGWRPSSCRSAARDGSPPGKRYPSTGFRVSRSLLSGVK